MKTATKPVNQKAAKFIESFGFEANDNGVIEEIPGFSVQGFEYFVVEKWITVHIATDQANKASTVNVEVYDDNTYLDDTYLPINTQGEFDAVEKFLKKSIRTIS